MLDTGIFDDDRYFDVFVEYAKAAPEDILMRVTVHNRGPEAAKILVLPQLLFPQHLVVETERAKAQAHRRRRVASKSSTPELGNLRLDCDGKPTLLFCDNETNVRRLFGQPEAPGFFKDAFHEYVIAGNKSAVNPAQTGTKAGALYELNVPAGGSIYCAAAALERRTVRHPASHSPTSMPSLPSVAARLTSFTPTLQHDITDADARKVQRQAFAGMIWSKQFYHYDVQEWLQGDPTQPPPPPERKHGRNQDWTHLNNAEVIPCRTNGSIRGMPRGIWRSIAFRWR